MSFARDLRVAIRSLARARSLWITVAVTLALGIGANAAIFSVVRGVLLRPLANRDEDRLLYLRQIALVNQRLAANQRGQVPTLLSQCPPRLRRNEDRPLETLPSRPSP